MSFARHGGALLLLGALGVGAGPARAVALVAGPIEIGPSWGQGDPQHSSALLSTILVNHGELGDRLIRVECPNAGQVALRNGTLHPDVQVPTTDQQRAALARWNDPNASHPEQNGLDVPPGLHEQRHPVTAQIDLTQAVQPLTDGSLVACSLYFAHAGQRIVIFSLGETPHPTDEP